MTLVFSSDQLMVECEHKCYQHMAKLALEVLDAASNANDIVENVSLCMLNLSEEQPHLIRYANIDSYRKAFLCDELVNRLV